VGGKVLSASDEFFAPKENLLNAAAPVFVSDKYTDRGKWMDGWESRRKRTPGHDWCVIRLGLPGVVRTVDVDTSYFVGNFPEHCSLDSASVVGDPAEKDWKPLLVKVRLAGGGHNLFDTQQAGKLTHVRLNIFPDGGIARLRLYGEVIPDIEKLKASSEPVDVASVVNGGRVLASSDNFFGHELNLILPGRPANMGGGWETRRRRGPGYDWIIVQLGARTTVQKISVETEHYKGNYPDRCSIDICDAAGTLFQDLITGKVAWTEIVPEAKLEADAVRQFESELNATPAATHVRLNIYPDGGVSRLRVFGKIIA
jgi:allantoicase